MERLIYKELLDWKNRHNRKPLILLGARQVGKTYILKKLGDQEFESIVYVNCHRDSYASNLFRDVNASRIVNELEAYYNVKIIEGKTLLFFDEIQEVRNGLASLKYFCEDHPALHVAVAGSLLGISLRENESYPVGKVETLRLFPLTFSEFLMAMGRTALLDEIRALDYETMKAQQDLLISLLREYYLVGGMPEVVKEYVESKDVNRIRLLQSEIIDAYRSDIAKHTKPIAQRINMVWDSIPSQLARENKKFVFGAVRKGGRASDFEMAIQWLVDAGIVYKIYRTKEPTRPLKFYADPNAFKLYLLDCGLLSRMSNAPTNEMLFGTNAFVEYKGAFTENFILQQLKPFLIQDDAFYFSKENSSQEIDFIVESAKRIIPIEVKAEVNVKSKSLSGFINNDHSAKHLKGARFSLLPYKDQDWMENIPLYASEEYFRKEFSYNSTSINGLSNN